MFGKSGFAKVALGGALTLGMLAASATPALADHRDQYNGEREKCERRISKAEEKLQREIYKHGRYSHQAENKRRDLWEVQQQCRWVRGRDRDDWRNRNWDDHR